MTPQELKNSILQLAIQGRLVEQRPEEGTAQELYQQIQAEKKRLIKEGKIKKEKPLPKITEDEKHFEIPESWMWVHLNYIASSSLGKTLRFLYKGIIIKHNKTEPTYTKTSLFLCEKRRFFMARTEKGGNIFKLAGPRGLAFFHLIKKEVSKWPMKK